MNVLICIVSLSLSFGEITNAYQFACELAGEGINIFFYSSNLFVRSYLFLNNSKFTLVDIDQIKGHEFDVILFSEYLNLFRVGEAAGAGISFIEENFLNKVKIGTIDSYQLSDYIKVKGSQLVFESDSKAFANVKLPDKDYFFVVNPCPMGYPGPKAEDSFNNYYWQRPLLEHNPEAEKRISQAFLIEPGTKRVFLPLSKWQQSFWNLKTGSAEDFTLRLGEFFTGLFDSLDLDITYSFFFGVPATEYKKYKNKNFSAYFFNPLSKSYIPPVLYEQFLAGTDLILTLHIIQNSFLRAVASGTPGINLTNNVSSNREGVNIRPVPPGFFLNNIKLDSSGIIGFNQAKIEGNPFYRTFKSFEVLAEPLAPCLKQLLLNGKTAAEEADFIAYNNGLKNCLKAGEIIRDVISG